MKIRYKLIDKKIADLLATFPTWFKAPVKIKKIIEALDIILVEDIFETEMSGAAIIDGEKRLILVNEREPETRKVFTLAHELGHLLLHYDSELNVDVQPIKLMRNEASSTGEQWREVEANYFAAALLMPTESVAKEFRILNERFDDEDQVLQALAKKFRVSIQAMSIRLGKLGLSKY